MLVATGSYLFMYRKEVDRDGKELLTCYAQAPCAGVDYQSISFQNQ
jgi:hypothetical protein